MWTSFKYYGRIAKVNRKESIFWIRESLNCGLYTAMIAYDKYPYDWKEQIAYAAYLKKIHSVCDLTLTFEEFKEEYTYIINETFKKRLDIEKECPQK